MQIFILEDDKERLLYFREMLLKHDLTVVDSCADVDKFTGPYDVVFLDHDLGGFERDHTKDNGCVFAGLIADRIGKAAVVIHSWNPDGALRMSAVLPQAVVAMFRSKHFDSILSQLT